MTRIRSIQQDNWDDAFWNSNHEHRKAKARKARHKGVKSSAIREGIEDYFEKNTPKKRISESNQQLDGFENVDDYEDQPQI